MSVLGRLFGRKPAPRESHARWCAKHLSGLAMSTVCPDPIDKNSDLYFSFCESHWLATYQGFLAGGETCWHYCRKDFDDYRAGVFAPARVVEKWYADGWAGEKIVWLDGKPHTLAESGGAFPCIATPELALRILNRLLNGLHCFGDDFPRWVLLNVGVDALRALSLSDAPLEVDEFHVWQYVEASKFFRVPLRVRVDERNHFHMSTGRVSWQEGYGDPDYPRTQGGRIVRSDLMRDWVPFGAEHEAAWPTDEYVLRLHASRPEFAGLWKMLLCRVPGPASTLFPDVDRADPPATGGLDGCAIAVGVLMVGFAGALAMIGYALYLSLQP